MPFAWSRFNPILRDTKNVRRAPRIEVLEDRTAPTLTVSNFANVSLAGYQIESGGDATENPDVTGGLGGPLVPYTPTASFLDATYNGPRLSDGDVGVGNPSSGIYAIVNNGSTLTLAFGSSQTIYSIAIYNGYANRDNGDYVLRDASNNVLAGWTISGTGGSSNAGVDSFWFQFLTPVTTTSLTISATNTTDAGGTVSYREIQVMLQGPVAYDYGDAPDTGPGTGSGNYQTSAADNGPEHVILGPRLGSSVDGELAAQPNASATGDDAASLDDENGVAFGALPVSPSVSTTGNVTVNLQNAPTAMLDAFIDFNRDGDFTDPGEQIFVSQNLVPGNNVLTFTIPAGTIAGSTVARFRVSAAGGLASTGPAPNGEVEDHVVTFSPAALSPSAAGLTLWLDASDISGNGTAALGNFATWVNKAGGANVTQPTPANQPTAVFGDSTLNGQPLVRFGGSAYYNDAITLASADGGFTVVAVVRAMPINVYHNIIDGNNGVRPMLWVDASNRYEFSFNTPGGGAVGDSVGDLDIVVATKSPGGGGQLYVDGVLIATGSVDWTAAASQLYDLFNRNAGTTSAFRGDVGEFLTYDHGLTAAERQQTEAYLRAKYAVNVDFGDAADPTFGIGTGNYQTTYADAGAVHVIAGPRLGATVTAEADALPNATATGDVDDGITFSATIAADPAASTVSSFTANVQNLAGTAILDAWIDFNQDGDFTDPGESIGNALVSAGDNVISFTVTAGASLGSTFARFRLSTAGGLAPTGFAADGEVEDYAVTIVAASTPATVNLPPGATAVELIQVGANRVLRSGSAILYSVPATSIASLTIAGNDGADDALTVTLSGGNPISTGGVSFGGGTGNDSVILNGSATLVAHGFTNDTDGSVGIDGRTLQYTSIQTLADNVAAPQRSFTFTGGTETIAITDSGGADGRTRVDSTLGASVDFLAPATSATFIANGGDTVNITAFDAAFMPSTITLQDTSGTTSVFNQTAANTLPDNSAFVLTGDVRLSLAGNDKIGPLASTDATPVIQLGAAVLTAGNGLSTTYSGALQGTTGGFIKTGSSTMILSGTNVYSGTTTVMGGTLTVSGGAAIPDASTVSVGVGTTFNLAASETINGLTLSSGTSTASSVTLGGNTLTLGGNVTHNAGGAGMTPAVVSGGTLDLGGAVRTVTVADGMIANAFDLDFAAAVANGGVVKAGVGTLRYSGLSNNTYSGATTVNNGTLVLSKTAAVAVVGPLVIGDGNNNAQPLNVKTAIVRVDQSNQIDDAAIISFGGSDGRLFINTAATETILAPTTFAGGDIKIAGTLISAGVYAQDSGTTTLAGGTLQVGAAGTLDSSLGTATVPGGVLQGSGTVRTKVLTSYGTIDPSSGVSDADFGNSSAGTITIHGNLQMTATSVTYLDVGAAASDQLNVRINTDLALPVGSYSAPGDYDLDPYLRGDVATVSDPTRRGVNDIKIANGTVRFHGELSTRPIALSTTPTSSVPVMNFVWRALDLPIGDLNPRGANLMSVPSDFTTKTTRDAGGTVLTSGTRYDPRFMGSGGQFNAVGQSVATMTKFAGVPTAVLTAPAYNVGQAKSLTLTPLSTTATPSAAVRVTKQLWNAYKDSHTRVTLTVTNTGATTQTGPFYIDVLSTPYGAPVFNAAGKRLGRPYLVVPASSLAAGASVTVEVDLLTPIVMGKNLTMSVAVLAGGLP